MQRIVASDFSPGQALHDISENQCSKIRFCSTVARIRSFHVNNKPVGYTWTNEYTQVSTTGRVSVEGGTENSRSEGPSVCRSPRGSSGSRCRPDTAPATCLQHTCVAGCTRSTQPTDFATSKAHDFQGSTRVYATRRKITNVII